MTSPRSQKTVGEVANLPAAEQISVALIPMVSDQLRRLQDRTSMSKTDITNRAITLYEFIDSQMQADREVLIRDKRTGEVQIVQIL
jgi:hypothetical protein